jgi:Undecaprenyl-phosphate galactose phosphotransferase WbaP
MASKPAIAFPSPVSLGKIRAASPYKTTLWLLAGDVVALSTPYWLTVLGLYIVTQGLPLSFYLTCFPAIGLYVLAFAVFGLYPGVFLHPAEELRRVTLAVSAVFVVFASFLFISRTAQNYPRSLFLITWIVGAPAVLLGRHALRHFCAQRPWWGQCAIVLGSGDSAQRLIRRLSDAPAGIRVVGVLADEYVAWPNDLPPILGYCGGANVGLASLANYIIVAVANRSPTQLKKAIQRSCQGFRHILLVPELTGMCSSGIAACDISGEVGFEVPQRLFHSGARIAKRVMDVVLSSLILLALLPVFLVVSVLIKCTSKGPVFFGHPRYGKDGSLFRAWKFRTMVENAEQVLRQHLLDHPQEQIEWQRDHKLRNDPRITLAGKWMRRYSLDELPQLWNVLMGHMSLVGPRPIVNAEIPKYGERYELYTRVSPGITGLWQVSGRNNTSYEERVTLDEYYIRNWSIWLDTYIIIRTIGVVVTAEGAY